MTLPKIIGITGYAGAGKTSIANTIIDAKPQYFRMSFADPLKSMLNALGIPYVNLRDPELKEQPHTILGDQTIRYAMETLGTDWGRKMIHPDIWVRAFQVKAEALTSLGGHIIVDDIRYQNEVDTVRELGGSVFKIVNPEQLPRVPSDHVVAQLTHTHTITNDRSLTISQVADILFAAATATKG